MVKKFLFVLALILILPLSLVFGACKNDDKESVKLPITANEKVQFAFNGVEKSFNNVNEHSKGQNVASAYDAFDVLAYSSTIDDSLSRIFAEYTQYNSESKNSIEGLEYNEPPMIQFQCLKYAIDKTGSNYRLGEKYYYTITGEMYLDMETGQKMTENKSDEYRYNYYFTLGIEIDIDEDDLIEAYVSFNIKLTHNNDEYNTMWYVYMNLDYDMNNVTPNYTLYMLTDNQEGELEYLNRIQGYEYNYVEVTGGQIKEWRKFEFEANEALVVDDEHQTFDSYANKAGFEYRVGNCKWYKDGTLHKFTRMNKPDGEQTKFEVAKALYEGIKLNSTDINAVDFITKQGNENNILLSLYNDFSDVFGTNLIYSLVCRDEEELTNKKAVGITIKTNSGEPWGEYTLYIDCSVKTMLSSAKPWGEGFMSVGHPNIFYVNSKGETLERIEFEELSNFTYKITIGNEIKDLGQYNLISDVIVDEFGGMNALESNGFKITFTLTESETQYTASFSVYIDFVSVITEKEAKIFPEILTNIGVPKYDTQIGLFNLDENAKEGMYTLRFDSNNDELNVYKNKLLSNGFIVDEFYRYVKIIGDNVLKISMTFSGSNLSIYIKLETNNNTYFSTWQTNTILNMMDGKFNSFPVINSENLLCEINTIDKYVYVFGLTNAERNAYLSSIDTLENVYVFENRIVFLSEGYFYEINYYNESEYLFLELNLERNARKEAYSIIVNGGNAQFFKLDASIPDKYTLTVTLNKNDTFTLTPNKIHIHEISYFSVDYNTKNYVVNESGTYTFTFEADDMQVIKI